MIKSGGLFLSKGTRCVIGAVIPINGTPCIATASHIFHEAGIGSRVQADGVDGTVKRFLEDFDVALIELPAGCKAEMTGLGSAIVMEEACLINEIRSIPCRVIRAGISLLSLQFPCFDMPQPGDSGSPIVQKGKVVGLLSSVMFSNCTGTAVSSSVLRNLGQ